MRFQGLERIHNFAAFFPTAVAGLQGIQTVQLTHREAIELAGASEGELRAVLNMSLTFRMEIGKNHVENSDELLGQLLWSLGEMRVPEANADIVTTPFVFDAYSLVVLRAFPGLERIHNFAAFFPTAVAGLQGIQTVQLTHHEAMELAGASEGELIEVLLE